MSGQEEFPVELICMTSGLASAQQTVGHIMPQRKFAEDLCQQSGGKNMLRVRLREGRELVVKGIKLKEGWVKISGTIPKHTHCLPRKSSMRLIWDKGSSISWSPFTRSNCSRGNISSHLTANRKNAVEWGFVCWWLYYASKGIFSRLRNSLRWL